MGHVNTYPVRQGFNVFEHAKGLKSKIEILIMLKPNSNYLFRTLYNYIRSLTKSTD